MSGVPLPAPPEREEIVEGKEPGLRGEVEQDLLHLCALSSFSPIHSFDTTPRLGCAMSAAGPSRLLATALRSSRPLRRIAAGTARSSLLPRRPARCLSSQANPAHPLEVLSSRSLLKAITSSALHSHLAEAPRTIYVGLDPSAASLHLGNLLPLLALWHLREAGHNGVVLVSSLTSLFLLEALTDLLLTDRGSHGLNRRSVRSFIRAQRPVHRGAQRQHSRHHDASARLLCQRGSMVCRTGGQGTE